ncbi:MAG: hypothetical protein CL875_02010 [Dehalococcoidales bacterium]|jgi:hypothetical protein|nr:hypothetical protein [Dehalococcoidales bacterium]|tara:strand:+ start:790 stop:1056 length:267 start_codon:yes stop_codon:yes gene_type:complete
MAHTSDNLYVDENGFIFDYKTGLTYSVNSTGVFIVRELLAGTPPSELTHLIKKKYSINHKTAASDLKAFLQQLSDDNLSVPSEVRTDD